jgi:hypothetical protein
MKNEETVTPERKAALSAKFKTILDSSPDFTEAIEGVIDSFYVYVKKGVTTSKQLRPIQDRELKESARREIAPMLEAMIDSGDIESLLKSRSTSGRAVFGRSGFPCGQEEYIAATFGYKLERITEGRYALHLSGSDEFKGLTQIIEIYTVRHPTSPYLRAVCPCGARRVNALFLVPGGRFECNNCRRENPEAKKRAELREQHCKEYGCYGHHDRAFATLIRWEAAVPGSPAENARPTTASMPRSRKKLAGT